MELSKMELNMQNVRFLRNILIGSVVIELSNSVRLFTNYAIQLKDIFDFTQTNSEYFLGEGTSECALHKIHQNLIFYHKDFFTDDELWKLWPR